MDAQPRQPAGLDYRNEHEGGGRFKFYGRRVLLRRAVRLVLIGTLLVLVALLLATRVWGRYVFVGIGRGQRTLEFSAVGGEFNIGICVYGIPLHDIDSNASWLRWQGYGWFLDGVTAWHTTFCGLSVSASGGVYGHGICTISFYHLRGPLWLAGFFVAALNLVMFRPSRPQRGVS